MLKLVSVNASYGPIRAIRDVTIEVNRGEIVCLIGSNGAGKTTALMTISGILKPDSGDIIFEGKTIKNLAAHDIVKTGICQSPEGRRIFSRLTVMENLRMGAYTIDRGETIKGLLNKVFDLFPVLGDRKTQMGGTLSGGEQQMLALGRALMSNPKLLLLDEPSLGLAPIMAGKIFRTIKEINRDGVTVLLVEQNAKAALKLSHRGYVLESGAVKLHGSGEELLHNEEVKRAYLGE